MNRYLLLAAIWMASSASSRADEPPSAQAVLAALREFYAKTARPDGSFQPGVDPEYRGMSDSAYSDLAAVTYACTIHKTFGWKLPHEEKTVEFLLSRQKESGDFVNVTGTVDPASPQGRTYNTTQALVALHALGIKPKYDPLPVFEEILKQDYKTLPAYSTSFFPLAYLCAGKPIPAQADRSIRALMVQDDDGYLNNHIAATFHASHYYALVGETTPKASQMVARALRDQKPDGSWLLNMPSRDRHATFDAVFTLKHEGQGRGDCREAIDRAAKWALSCRNSDGGFGHFPGSTSDADAVYFQVGTLVMAGFLQPADPLPPDPHLLSWGHLMPLRKEAVSDPVRIPIAGWVSSLALNADGSILAVGGSDGSARLWNTRTKAQTQVFQGHKDCVASVALSRDGSIVVTGSYDKTARVWDSQSGRERHLLQGHHGAVMSVACSPLGPFVVTGGVDTTAQIWDSKSGGRSLVFLDRLPKDDLTREHGEPISHKSWVNSVVFSPNSQLVYSGSSDGTVKAWRTNGKLLRTLDASKAEVRSVAVSPDGKLLAAGIRYGAVKVWSTDDWELKQSWEHHGDDAWAVAFTADSQRLLIAAGEWNRPATIVERSVATGEVVREYKHPGEVLCLAVSADGKTIAAGGGDKTVSVWKLP
jgi:geranylgeranyl transferase type-2 subunit beta